MYVPGNRMSMLLADQVVDSELKTLAANIPLRVRDSSSCTRTADKYSRAYNEFQNWTSKYDELVSLPASAITVVLYLEYLLQNGFPYSRLECAFYGINWVHNMFGMSSPCASPIVNPLSGIVAIRQQIIDHRSVAPLIIPLKIFYFANMKYCILYFV